MKTVPTKTAPTRTVSRETTSTALPPKPLMAAMLAAAATLAACSGGSGDAGRGSIRLSGDGGVVETVNGEAVPQRLLDALAETRGMDLANPAMRDRALKQLTEMVLLAQAAQKEGFDKDAQFAAMAEFLRLQGLATATTKRLHADTVVDDAAVRAEYDKQGPTTELEFGQMLFASKDLADAAAADIAGGKPWEQVVEARRKDARIARDFPKVRSTALPPPLKAALADLKPGETTKAPLQTPQGWMLVHLKSSADVPPLPFEQVREGLRRSLARKAGDERIEQLRQQAKIVVTDPPPASTLPPAPRAQPLPPMARPPAQTPAPAAPTAAGAAPNPKS